MLGLIGLIIAA